MSKPLQRRTTSSNGSMLDRRVTLMDIDQLQEDGAYLPTADDAKIVADVEQSSSEPLSASASHAQAFKFGLTGLSAMTAESATFPVDMCKTRMQLSGEGVGQLHGAVLRRHAAAGLPVVVERGGLRQGGRALLRPADTRRQGLRWGRPRATAELVAQGDASR